MLRSVNVRFMFTTLLPILDIITPVYGYANIVFTLLDWNTYPNDRNSFVQFKEVDTEAVLYFIGF